MNVVAYCRYSSNLQREESITAQIRAIELYCKNNGYVLVDTYTDEAISGTGSEDRPQFTKLLEDCKREHFEGVIVHKLDRFARNRYDSAIARERLKRCDKKLISVLENLDDTPESALMESLLEGMAEYYSKNLAREVKKGLNENALKCRHNGGRPPLGYDIGDDRTYIINVPEAEIVKSIFGMYGGGLGYSQIALELNEQGLKNKVGRDFNKTSIRDTLLNEKYIGVYFYGKKDTKGYLTGTEVRIENGMPSIVEKELFELIQNKMKNREFPKAKTNTKVDYFLSGYIRCGVCGGSYTGGYRSRNRNGSVFNGYMCIARKTKKAICDCKPIRKELLEEFVFNELKDKVFNESILEDITDRIYSHLLKSESENKGKKIVVEREEQKIKDKIGSLLELYLEGKILKEIFEKKNSELEKLLVAVQKDRLTMREDNNFLDKDKIREYIKKMSFNLDTRKKTLILTVLNTFIESIVVDNNKIEVNISLYTAQERDGGCDGNRTHVRNC